MKYNSICMPVMILACLCFLVESTSAQENRWEKTIQGFERADAKSFPPQESILFIGSSSIRMWDLEKYFPGKNYINRGFGGSEIADSVEFADRVILLYKPRMIVFFAGGNDLARGKAPEQVIQDFHNLAAKVHATLPNTEIIAIAVKPSPKRWDIRGNILATNNGIEAFAADHPKVHFINIYPPMLDESGEVRAELFVKDGLHLNAEGYKLWSNLVRQKIKELEADHAVAH
ncbi:Argininosuccinate lyase [Planctomycetales bacterium 10988]|nr:Argininosuccinate lyase [Planctomycetales bacterium 10988]